MILLALICKRNVAVKSLSFHRNIQHAATHFLRRQDSAPFFKYERLNYVPPRGRTVFVRRPVQQADASVGNPTNCRREDLYKLE